MKVLKNKTTEIDVSNDSTKKVTFADLAKACINNVPQGGLDVIEMQSRLDVMKKLNTSNGEISLENAEAESFISQTVTFISVSPLINYINEIQEIKQRKNKQINNMFLYTIYTS